MPWRLRKFDTIQPAAFLQPRPPPIDEFCLFPSGPKGGRTVMDFWLLVAQTWAKKWSKMGDNFGSRNLFFFA